MNEKKKMTPLMICHLILMVLFALGTLTSTVLVVAGTMRSTDPESVSLRTGVILSSIPAVLITLALICGIAYLAKGYSKDAAHFYKAFMLLFAAATAFQLITMFSMLDKTGRIADYTATPTAMTIGRIALFAVKLVLLVILSFGKDLGKRNTWIIFYAILGIDLAYGILLSPADNTAATFYRIMTSLSRLLMDGTIGLSIKGKYDDKTERGTS